MSSSHRCGPLLAALVLLTSATGLHAQLLESFSAFSDGGTLFFGAWSASGDPFAGDPLPAAELTQSPGAFRFSGTTDLDTAFAERWFSAPLDLSGSNRLGLSLLVGADNTAPSLTVSVFDQALESASATFSLSDFAPGVLSTREVVWTPFGSFNASGVIGFRLSGNQPSSSAVLSVTVDELRATGAAFTPVPEPGLFSVAAAVLLILVGCRRLRGSTAS